MRGWLLQFPGTFQDDYRGAIRFEISYLGHGYPYILVDNQTRRDRSCSDGPLPINSYHEI